MLKYLCRLIGKSLARDSHLSVKHPFLYPVVKMTILFIMIQVIILIMYQFSETESDYIQDESAHPPNNHTSIFPIDHTPLMVIDDGSLKTLYRLLSNTDVAMVMMYAPWCYHSGVLAQTMVKVAKSQSEVTFIAINCWSGDCRRMEGAGMYPRIMIHRRHIKGRMEYYGGRSYQSLLSYSHKLVRPIHYITNSEEFYNLLDLQELLIVGYFNFTNGVMSYDYKQYYLASLLCLQTDHTSRSFPAQYMTVITNNNINIKLPHPSPSISIIGTHKGILEVLPIDNNITPNKINQWIINCTDKYKLVKEFIPAGDISGLMTTPISLLFLPLSANRDSNVTKTLSQYITAASLFHMEPIHYNMCDNLNHLRHVLCTDHTHMSLPLCNTNPSHSFCPKYNPLQLNRYIPYNNTVFCQDMEGGVVTGGWPPPCTHVRTSFYYVDSNKYWSLAQSMGVANKTIKAGQFMIFIDFKNHLQFINYFNGHVTTSNTFNEIWQDVVSGQATPLYRSGCGHDNCSLSEITADQFNSIIIQRPHSIRTKGVIIIHYVNWCSVCTSLWPIIQSINNNYNNHTHFNILRINGDYNDIPKCHAPKYYPSIALYNNSSIYPVWFPENDSFSIENIMEFIVTHLQLVSHDYDSGLEEVAEWEGMGWHLWEISERHRKSIEERNVLMGDEISLLREKISILEKKQCNEDHSDSSSTQIESLISQLSNIINPASNNNNNNNNNNNDT